MKSCFQVLHTLYNISHTVLYTQVLHPMCHTVKTAHFFHYKHYYIQVSMYCSDMEFKSRIPRW
jgi:hypothetical protein